MTKAQTEVSVPAKPEFLQDVLSGLSKQPKQLHCKYFYDERGSQLFDQICKLDEYYLTSSEQAIMDCHIHEMASQIGESVMLVELGSGSSVKTLSLLDVLRNPVAYVPVDISEDHLYKTARKLALRYPRIEILPCVADFTDGFELPKSSNEPSHAAVYFPGSTIGNLTAAKARELLVRIADVVGPDGGLLIGIDLQKDPSIIHAAYNDADGITAAFNLNILHRINSELGANFDVESFSHLANYDETEDRVEIQIVSDVAQDVIIDGQTIQFNQGEKILTEYSHKYTIEGFCDLAAEAHFSLHKSWTDSNELFAVLHLVNERQQGA